ncbi:hypothetical protein SDC9_155702 [bioreactor metagenome]|uniref:Uncharacterized protein n=1 Tax=bioreactor metagenome TaxID=1076179 RepID=A0A645F3J7_9ZZZZ
MAVHERGVINQSFELFVNVAKMFYMEFRGYGEPRFIFFSRVARADHDFFIRRVGTHFSGQRVPYFFLMELHVALMTQVPAVKGRMMQIAGFQFIDQPEIDGDFALPVIEHPELSGIEQSDVNFEFKPVGFGQKKFQQVLGIMKQTAHYRGVIHCRILPSGANYDQSVDSEFFFVLQFGSPYFTGPVVGRDVAGDAVDEGAGDDRGMGHDQKLLEI